LSYLGGNTWENEGRRRTDSSSVSRPARLVKNLREVLASGTEPREIFYEFTRVLEQGFRIRKGLLALREENQTQFLAIASWRAGSVHKRLSLRLPTVSSLFQKIAEDGRGYSDSFAGFFDGNMMERRLLMDEDTQSFVLRPIKYEGRVVAMLGYSSDSTDAFATLEESVLDPVTASFGEMIGRYQARLASS
jgi:hypothetical protein